MIPECDCEVVDDPDEVCPKHQSMLYEYVRKLEKALEKINLIANARTEHPWGQVAILSEEALATEPGGGRED